MKFGIITLWILLAIWIISTGFANAETVEYRKIYHLFACHASSNPAGGATIYFSSFCQQGGTTNTGDRASYIPITGVINKITWTGWTTGTLASAESAQLYLNIDGTDHAIDSSLIKYNNRRQGLDQDALGIYVSADQVWQLKIIYPSWGTTPTGISDSLDMYLEATSTLTISGGAGSSTTTNTYITYASSTPTTQATTGAFGILLYALTAVGTVFVFHKFIV